MRLETRKLRKRLANVLKQYAHAIYFVHFDLIQSYQVELTDRSKSKTTCYAPQCNQKQWEYVPVGLARAPQGLGLMPDNQKPEAICPMPITRLQNAPCIFCH